MGNANPVERTMSLYKLYDIGIFSFGPRYASVGNHRGGLVNWKKVLVMVLDSVRLAGETSEKSTTCRRRVIETRSVGWEKKKNYNSMPRYFTCRTTNKRSLVSVEWGNNATCFFGARDNVKAIKPYFVPRTWSRR